jgi:hypothetical protein
VVSASAAIATSTAWKALEVLVVRLGVELDRADADQLGLGLDPGLVEADAVLAVIGERIRHGPEIGQLHADDDVGVGNHRQGRAEMVGLREVHAGAHVDDARLQRLGKLNEKPDAVLGARRAIDDDHRPLGVGQEAAPLPSRQLLSPCGAEVGVYFGM